MRWHGSICGTLRHVPWDDDVPFFLGDFVAQKNGKEVPHPVCPRQLLKRVLKRAEKLGLIPMCGMEFEWFNFAETPQSWADKGYVRPQTITPGMFGYSLLRANQNRDFFKALMVEMGAFDIPIEGLHTETGPGVYEVAILFSEALEAADRAILFKTGAKEIGSRFGHHAQLHGQVECPVSGVFRAYPPEPVGRPEEPVLRPQGPQQHEQAVRELSCRPGRPD